MLKITFLDDERVWTELEPQKDALQAFCMEMLSAGYFDELAQTERGLQRLESFILHRANFISLCDILTKADFSIENIESAQTLRKAVI